MVTKIGLDLGYANITLSDVTAEIYREPSVALIYREPQADGRRIISVGSAAIQPQSVASSDDVLLVRPFKNGLLFDHQITREVIHNAIKAIDFNDKLRCLIGVPADILPKQEKDLFSMLEEAGVTSAFSVSRAVAALVGAGYSPKMSAISVNIGAMSTEIAVLHNGELLVNIREKIGGEDFDRAVKKHILEQGDVNVSLMVARSIKEKLGAVWKGKPNDSLDIEGTLSLTGNKLKMNITTEDIVGVFEGALEKLMMAVVSAVKKIPANAVEDIFKNGVILSGGGAELFGLDTLMSKVLGISVTRPSGAIDCVAKGLSRINTFLPTRIKTGGKNITSQVAKYYESSKE